MRDEEARVAKQRRPSSKRPASGKKTARSERAAAEAVKVTDASSKPGFFRNLITESRVSGPILITHTRADKAVGLAYAIASRVAGQIAADMGDQNDPFGGLGSNGAQKTVEAKDEKMPKAGTAFAPEPAKGSITNLLADGLISSHGDVRNPNAAYAVLSAACA